MPAGSEKDTQQYSYNPNAVVNNAAGKASNLYASSKVADADAGGSRPE